MVTQLVLVTAVFAFLFPVEERPAQPRPPSVDTLQPEVTGTMDCGTFFGVATEFRNIPDPPRSPAIDSDQVETGVAYIDTIPGAGSFNYRVVIVTDSVLPKEPSYKRVDYRVEVIDPTKDAYCVYGVYDWADNVALDTLSYTAPSLTASPSTIDFRIRRVGERKQDGAWITNTCPVRITIQRIDLKHARSFELSYVTKTLPTDLEPGDSMYVMITYLANRETESIDLDVDRDTVLVATECRQFSLPVVGVAAVPRIHVNDYDAGVVAPGNKTCTFEGLRISSVGTDTVIVTEITCSNWSNFTISPSALASLPFVIPPGQDHYLKDVCYQRMTDGIDSTIVRFRTNALAFKDTSVWTGRTPLTGVAATNTLLPRARFSGNDLDVSWKGASVSRIVILDIAGRVLAERRVDASTDSITITVASYATQTLFVFLFDLNGTPQFVSTEIAP